MVEIAQADLTEGSEDNPIFLAGLSTDIFNSALRFLLW